MSWRRFSRLRWLFLCAAGLRHREAWFLVRQGSRPARLSRCSRCGVVDRPRRGVRKVLH